MKKIACSTLVVTLLTLVVKFNTFTTLAITLALIIIFTMFAGKAYLISSYFAFQINLDFVINIMGIMTIMDIVVIGDIIKIIVKTIIIAVWIASYFLILIIKHKVMMDFKVFKAIIMVIISYITKKFNQPILFLVNKNK